MKTICAIVLLLISFSAAARAQEPCVTGECQSKALELLKRQTGELICNLNEEPLERYTCLLALTPPRRTCQEKKIPQEQIECLEAALDTLIRSLPAMVAEQVKKEMQPRLH
jgi:hypothetical protein